VNSSSKGIAIGVAALAAIVLVIALVAGGGDEDTTAPSGGVESAGGDPAAVATFQDTCGECHTLTVAGTSGDVGPDLDDVAFTRDRVLAAIENGAGNGAMAAGLLEGAEADAVAELIATDDPALAEPVSDGESK